MLLLGALTACPGEVVSREELQKQLWPGDTFVDFETGLNAAVRKLREALADNPENPRYIETIPKRGYRFLGEIDSQGMRVPSVSSGEPSPKADLTSTGLGRRTIASLIETVGEHRRAKYLWMIVAAGFALCCVGLTLVELNVIKVPRLQGRVFGASGASAIHSIAVLPLQNLSNDPAQEYLSDGLTDALITDLAQIGSLKVISRTSSTQYRGTKKSLPEVASELNVNGIIEGTLQRSGDRVRITAQLIDGRTDQHLWANSYERDFRDLFALERDITHDIAQQVQGRITARTQLPVQQPEAPDPKALEAYLQGNYYLYEQGRGFGDEEKKKAADFFQQAIDADPDFARAFIGLAQAHYDLLIGSSEDTAIRRRAAEKAVKLDPTCSDARVVLGWVKFQPYLDWQGAEKEFREAIALNPNNANAHDGLAGLLGGMGRLDEELRESQIAQELDPDQDHLSDALWRRRDYDGTIAIQRMMLKRHPDDGYLHWYLFQTYAVKGMHKESIQEMQEGLRLFGLPEGAERVQRAYAIADYRGAIRQVVKEIEDLQTAKQAFLPGNLAELYTILGDKDRAFFWLQQAYEHREMSSMDSGLYYMRTDPMYDPLRSDPRFQELVHRIGPP